MAKQLAPVYEKRRVKRKGVHAKTKQSKNKNSKLQEALRLSGTMSVLVDIEEYDEPGIKICPNGTQVKVLNLVAWSLFFPLSRPKNCGYGSAKRLQMAKDDMPEELSRVRSMDEWLEMPREFRQKFSPYIEEEFRRRREAFGSITTVSLRILRVGIT